MTLKQCFKAERKDQLIRVLSIQKKGNPSSMLVTVEKSLASNWS